MKVWRVLSEIDLEAPRARRFYRTLDEAIHNDHGYFPGVNELSREFLSTDGFKPIKISRKEYDGDSDIGWRRDDAILWGWVKAYGENRPSPLLLSMIDGVWICGARSIPFDVIPCRNILCRQHVRKIE